MLWLSITEKTSVRRLGHSVTEFIAEPRAVRLALLAQCLQPFRIGSE